MTCRLHVGYQVLWAQCSRPLAYTRYKLVIFKGVAVSTTCLLYSCLNVFFVSSASSGDAHLKMLSDVAQAVKGQGTIAWVNCG